MNDFKSRFRELKNDKNVSYQDIANLLDISVRAVQHYASGDRFPDFQGLIKLANFFDVSIDYLVGRTDNPQSHKLK